MVISFVVLIASTSIDYFWLAMTVLGLVQLGGAYYHIRKHEYYYPMNILINYYVIGIVVYTIVTLSLYYTMPNSMIFNAVFYSGSWGLAIYKLSIAYRRERKKSRNSGFLTNLEFE
jgi:hypothetical protein